MKKLTSSAINYVHCAGDLAGTFAIRREADFVTRDGVLTFADVTLEDGKKLPVSLHLALSMAAAPYVQTTPPTRPPNRNSKRNSTFTWDT